MKKNMLVLVLAALAGTLGAVENAKTGPSQAGNEMTAYPLKVCTVSGEKLGEHGDPYVIRHEGREVRFCCKSCLKDFNADPAKYLKKLDAAVEAQQRASYPLKDCPVSLDKLGAHGEPVPVVVGNNTLALLCCKDCKKDAVKDGARIEKMILDARKKP